MDNPLSESSNDVLSIESAADAFGAALEPKKPESTPEAKEAEALDAEAKAEAEKADKPESEADPIGEDSDKVTIEVDGKTVELTKAELADAYKNGLRQADYTKKTMEAAEFKRTADAEINKARQDRDNYAQGLHKNALTLQAVIEQQNNIDWNALLDADPVEFMKQKHLFDKRQVALQETTSHLQQIYAQSEAEQAEQKKSYISEQRDQLLAKLPDWKDESKAKVEAAEIRDYLISQGFEINDVANIVDHRAVLLGRKAMKFDQMMAKAKAAAKRVETLPQKVMKPGVGDTPNLDMRSAAMRQLSKSGRIEDAASFFPI